MWFLSKRTKQKQQRTSEAQFLRKGLPERWKYRTVGKKEQWHIGRIGTVFLWVLFFGTLFYTVFFSTFFLVGEPRITGMGEVSEKVLREFVDSQLSIKYFHIFSRNNFFLVRPKELEEQLHLEYPLLASVSITRIFPKDLSIVVTERKKIILWNSLDRSYLIDEDGRAHDSTRALLPENMQYVLSITDTSNKEVTLGEKVYDASYGTFVIQLSELFPEQLELRLEPRYTVTSRFAGEVRAKTNEGFEIYFGTDIPLESSFNVLKLLFEKELTEEKRLKLAYIDLRTENRAYYAYRVGENPTSVSPPVVVEMKKIGAESKDRKK